MITTHEARCPHCKFWHAIETTSYGLQWENSDLANSCPSCGYICLIATECEIRRREKDER
jgi:hypothetical protein